MSIIDDFLANPENASSLSTGATAPPYVRQGINDVAQQSEAQAHPDVQRFQQILQTVLPGLAAIYAAHKGQLGSFTGGMFDTQQAQQKLDLQREETRRRLAAEERMVTANESLINYRKVLEQHQQDLETAAAIKDAVKGFEENPAYPNGIVPGKVAENMVVNVPGVGPKKLSDAFTRAGYARDVDGNFHLKPAKSDVVPPKQGSEEDYVKRAVDMARQSAGRPLTDQETQSVTEKALSSYKKFNRDTSNDATNALIREQILQNDKLLGSLRKTQIDQAAGTPVTPGTKEYDVAKDLASYKLTYEQFIRQYAYSRSRAQMQLIYDKARELNPDWNPAQAMLGYKFASNPMVQRTMVNIVNAKAGIDQMIDASEEAKRSGIKILNDKVVIPGGIQVGDKSYSNYSTALTAFADELSLALGGGGAGTDMVRQMAQQMVTGGLDADAFRSQLLQVVMPFLERRRQTFLGGMGAYGDEKLNPAAKDAAPPKSTKDPGKIR